MPNLKKYNEKRDFNKTKEPVGKVYKTNKKLKFCVQHHDSRRDHYDFRLELNGVMLSWAIPKGPSYNPSVKRLAVHVEDHPLSYRTFEGTIPKGEYGGGTVMLWDIGYWVPTENPNTTYKKGYLKFTLKGDRLKGDWTLIHFKENNWLLIKEKDNVECYKDINEFNTSIKTGRTMEKIRDGIKKKKKVEIEITNPDKVMYKNPKITKKEIVDYYKKVFPYMFPYLENRLISTVRAPGGLEGERFFKKHFKENKYLGKKGEYYYIKDIEGFIKEVQMNSIEFHIWGSRLTDNNHPDMLVFDLDPDESLNIASVREGVKDLKSILDKLKLKSYLKTSGGKGYHIVVPLKNKPTWKEFRKIANDVAKLMEETWPDKYTSNIRKEDRIGKIFIDWVRNTKGATSVAPYSLRIRKNCPVSMPIRWSELEKVKPNEITIKDAIKRLKRKNPWEGFFD